MNDQDILFLKSKLDDCPTVKNSEQLDHLVLTASRDQAEQIRQSSRAKPWVLINRFAAVGLAVVITLSSLVVMKLAVQPEEPLTAAQEPVQSLRYVSKPPSIDSILSQYRIEKPERSVATKLPPTQLERDIILKELGLPDPRVLIAQLNSGQADQVRQAEADMALAFNDIEALISEGELDIARSRYNNLLSQCQGCGLPSSLEALLIETSLQSLARALPG